MLAARERCRYGRRPIARLARGRCAIRVRAAGLNFADVMAAQGLYPTPRKPPCVVGYEAAGAVDALGGGVLDHAVGQRVVALTHFGGHADVVCVPARQVFQILDEMSFEEAAALPVNYPTAYHMLFRVACVRPGAVSGCWCIWRPERAGGAATVPHR